MSARTIFVMLYVGAIEGSQRWARPDQITKMTDRQAAKLRDEDRLSWAQNSLSPGKMKDVPHRWYAGNTREPIRDESLRNGLIPLGAVIEKSDIPTTSAKPRYALAASFLALLEALARKPHNPGKLILEWQSQHLSPEALARVHLVRQGVAAGRETDRILVKFPNGETRLLLPGPSAVITKAVIEQFAPRFLNQPAVLFISESGAKVVARDDKLARQIGLRIEADRNLPDIILVDVDLKSSKLIFIEVVASDGAITTQKQAALQAIAAEARFSPASVYYITAFSDRTAAPFKKNVSELAWDSFAWFASEPKHLLVFKRDARLICDALR
jgi:hypothetical protein